MDGEHGRGEIVVYQAADGAARVDVRFEGDTVWLTEEATVRKFRTVHMEGT